MHTFFYSSRYEKFPKTFGIACAGAFHTSGFCSEGEEGEDGETDDPTIRFPKLAMIDAELGETKPKNYDNNFTLSELIDNFRCFSASQLKLYYDFEILRPFFAGLACSKLIILQGISGTGKTSLAYAWGKFVKMDSCVSYAGEVL